MRNLFTIILLLSGSIACFGQFDPSINHSGKLEIPESMPSVYNNNGTTLNPSEITCNPTSFWAVGSGQIISFSLEGNNVINNGNLMPSAGNSLAFCNNLNGGTPSPTFYTNKTLTKAGYYNGTTWTTCTTQPTSWIVNGGGYGDFLYFTSHDTVTFDEIGITKYNGSSYTNIYKLSDTSRAITVADVVADQAGNVWFCVGNHTTLFTDTLNVMSPTGVMLKQYPFQLNTDNAYGCFMMNGTIYIGLGGANPEHPFTLIPVNITGNTAVAGSPITMPANSYADLASCTPGSPLAIEEHYETNNFNIYPNPAKESIYIELTGNQTNNEPVLIYSSQGKIVIQLRNLNTNQVVDISNLPAGIYIIRIGDQVRKIIKE